MLFPFADIGINRVVVGELFQIFIGIIFIVAQRSNFGGDKGLRAIFLAL